MAITATNLTASLSNTAGTSFTTASISPSANKLLLCVISSRRGDSIQPLSPTVTGCGLTWVQVVGMDWDTTVPTMKRTTVFRAMGTPTSGTLTFDFGTETQSHANWIVDQFDGVKTSGTNGSAAVVQAVPTVYQGTTPTYISTTLAAFSSVNNATWAAESDSQGTLPTPDSGFSQLGWTGVNTSTMASFSEFYSGNSTTVGVTIPSTSSAGIIGVELAAAGPIVGSLGQFDPEMRILGWF